jgi:hypothetical protein
MCLHVVASLVNQIFQVDEGRVIGGDGDHTGSALPEFSPPIFDLPGFCFVFLCFGGAPGFMSSKMHCLFFVHPGMSAFFYPRFLILNYMYHPRDDCGFFMLKFIELWTRRKMLNVINPQDLPIIRKQLTLKWLQWVDNVIAWQEILF